MVANAQKTQEAEQESANNPPKNPWLRQEGEPILWFNRFHRYRDLGTKRSLLATLEQERRTIKVQKSTKSTKKSGVGLSEKTPPQAKALKAVPPSKQVPGSWKQASITWRWVERAKAYDEYAIDALAEQALQRHLDGLAGKHARIEALKKLANHLQTAFNTMIENGGVDFDRECQFVARMQSLLKQIADEMATLDEAVARAILRKNTARKYAEITPEERETFRQTGSVTKSTATHQ